MSLILLIACRAGISSSGCCRKAFLSLAGCRGSCSAASGGFHASILLVFTKERRDRPKPASLSLWQSQGGDASWCSMVLCWRQVMSPRSISWCCGTFPPLEPVSTRCSVYLFDRNGCKPGDMNHAGRVSCWRSPPQEGLWGTGGVPFWNCRNPACLGITAQLKSL